MTEGGGRRTGAQVAALRPRARPGRTRPGRVGRGLVMALVLAVTAVLGGAPAAVAASGPGDDDRITRYDVTIDVDADGVALVDTVLDVDFGAQPGAGPALTYVTAQRFDADHDRVYRITAVEATSRTAPDDVHLAHRNGLLEIRLGGRDADLTGVHSYRLTYRVEGWVSSAEAFGLDRDELVLNVVGDAWTLPVLGLNVTVGAPGPVLDARCYAGPDATCTSSATDGTVATFAEPTLVPGESLTVALAYPAGTFGGVEPIVVEHGSAGRTAALAGLGVVAVGLGVTALRHVRRAHADPAPPA